MNKKIIALAAILICVTLAAFALVPGKPVPSLAGGRAIVAEQQSEETRTAYQEKLDRLKEFKERHDLTRLVQLADEIQAQRTSLSQDYYTDLMIEVVGALSGYDFKDDRQHVLALKYAKAALDKADQLSIQGEIKLVRFLEGGPEYDSGQMKANDWEQDRRERVKYWLHASRRFERQSIGTSTSINALG